MSSSEKRAAAQKAETDFFALLKESGIAQPGAVWKEVGARSKITARHHRITHCWRAQVKRKIVDDPRYDAVGSSHLREELFDTFVKARGSTSRSDAPEGGDAQLKRDGDNDHADDSADREQKRKERKERAVKEREEKVQAERNKLGAEIDRSRLAINKEEGELEFRCARVHWMLAVRSTWRH